LISVLTVLKNVVTMNRLSVYSDENSHNGFLTNANFDYRSNRCFE